MEPGESNRTDAEMISCPSGRSVVRWLPDQAILAKEKRIPFIFVSSTSNFAFLPGQRSI
jgi:hypothetical protein